MAENGEIAPKKAKEDGRGDGQGEMRAGDGAEEESSRATQGECGERRHTGAVGSAGIREDGFEATESGPTKVGDAGQVAENERSAEGDGCAQAAEPIHLTGKREAAGAHAGRKAELVGHETHYITPTAMGGARGIRRLCG